MPLIHFAAWLTTCPGVGRARPNAGRQFEVLFYPTARRRIFGKYDTTLMYNFMVKSMGKPEAKRQFREA